MGTVTAVIVGTIAAAGALVVLVSAIGMLRERDVYCRIGHLGTIASVGIPLLVTAGYVEQYSSWGFSWYDVVRYLVTVGALLVVSSEASNVLGRASYMSGAPMDEHTHPQDLGADAPPPGEPGDASR